MPASFMRDTVGRTHPQDQSNPALTSSRAALRNITIDNPEFPISRSDSARFLLFYTSDHMSTTLDPIPERAPTRTSG
jgi:hypothetical protein